MNANEEGSGDVYVGRQNESAFQPVILADSCASAS